MYATFTGRHCMPPPPESQGFLLFLFFEALLVTKAVSYVASFVGDRRDYVEEKSV
jgi:hypothetical protein